MEATDLEAKLGRSNHDYKRSDPEKTPGEVDDFGDAKRLCEGDHDHNGAMKMEVEEEDEEEEDLTPYQPFGIYCKNWTIFYGHEAKFDDPTELPPMRRIDGPMLPMGPIHVETMEIYYVKVVQITGKLQWPLDVYGDVAVRDNLDYKRNYLFRRCRQRCQTLTSPQDALLELVGPSRAVMLLDPADFEIFLKVKAKEETEEDTALCCRVFGYNSLAYKGVKSYARTEVVSSEHSTIEAKYGHLMCTLEATIFFRITCGPGNFCARLTARGSSIREDVVLLETRGCEVSVAKDGEVVLQRRVVVVEEQGNLILGIKAAQLGDDAESSTHVETKMTFRARSALRSECYFKIGSTTVQMMVAWSVLP